MEELIMRKERLASLMKDREMVMQHITNEFPEVFEYMQFCRDKIRNVIIILGSARGGTSAFKGVLGNFPNVSCLSGEHRHLFTLLGYNFPDHGGSYEEKKDQLLGDEEIRYILNNMYFESYVNQNESLSDRELELYGWDWASKLPIQWPDVSFSPDKIVSIVKTFYKENELLYNNQNELFFYKLIKCFEENFKGVDSAFYDAPLIKLQNKDFQLQALKENFYQNRLIVEIPPFLLLKPRKLSHDYNHTNTLVVKASSDCYRIHQIDSLFEGFNKFYVHLKRNPLSSVNGLLDGWKHHTFGQHDLNYLEKKYKVTPSPEIKREFSWKFDLFEDWQLKISKPLKEVAVSQWCHSHEKILQFKKEIKNNWTDLYFEDFQGSIEQRMEMFKKVSLKIEGMEAQLPLDAIKNPAVINATSTPSAQRWKTRNESIIDILQNKQVIELCDELGYRVKDYQSWL
ncbi:hypothetical protein HUB98_19355 [Paenibacillus barcinonensis]|uniref:Sulfotransferase family protein n=1 Tax=Paenibacillus barcinonensis TaxID=198119 RepID=A0A2V4VLX1_PAEBA|nr:hypothetical protein [Paenibacillus barcinonensis]PYE47282.1 hypothetical protein DFQ00_11422 [Paenibacillus barcinonensis]QKS58188.1 hypothetical protein HUB98_19355 [Paenibacillus barcinonensis]